MNHMRIIKDLEKEKNEREQEMLIRLNTTGKACDYGSKKSQPYEFPLEFVCYSFLSNDLKEIVQKTLSNEIQLFVKLQISNVK